MTAVWVYFMTNRPNGVLYVGVTDNLPRRAWEHREGIIDGFTKRYGLKRLVYYEQYEDVRHARQREQKPEALLTRLEGSSDPAQQPKLGRFVRPAYLMIIDNLVDGRAKPGHER